jgi:hypothetical protein
VETAAVSDMRSRRHVGMRPPMMRLLKRELTWEL